MQLGSSWLGCVAVEEWEHFQLSEEPCNFEQFSTFCMHLTIPVKRRFSLEKISQSSRILNMQCHLDASHVKISLERNLRFHQILSKKVRFLYG